MVAKQGVVLPPLLLIFLLECAVRKIQEYLEGLKFGGIYQLLPLVDNFNL
jgi:hypothetical protein